MAPFSNVLLVPANALLAAGRSLGRLAGGELKVELSDHSINTQMRRPDKDERAWDDSMFKHGNVFVEGYGNPIKPRVNYHETLQEPDRIDHEEGDGDEDDDSDAHVELISSPRYRDYMRQDLVSQLLTPRERWRIIAYGVLAVGALVLLNLGINLVASGAV